MLPYHKKCLLCSRRNLKQKAKEVLALLMAPKGSSHHWANTCPRFPPRAMVTLPFPCLPAPLLLMLFPGLSDGTGDPNMVGQVLSLVSHLFLKD